MIQVYLGIGSNIDREFNIRSGVSHLKKEFGTLTLSAVYESDAVGFKGDPFYNLVASFQTDWPVHKIALILKNIEDTHKRDRSNPSFSPRTLDIDLLLYGDQIIQENGLALPRDEILKYTFVLRPLAEINGQATHPITQQSYIKLWENFDQSRQPLKRVTLEFG